MVNYIPKRGDFIRLNFDPQAGHEQSEKVTGIIMTDQLRSLDYRARKAIFISMCPEELLQEVLMHIEPILF